MKKLILLALFTPACALFRPHLEVYAERFCASSNGSTVKTVFRNRAGTYVQCMNGSTIEVVESHE